MPFHRTGIILLFCSNVFLFSFIFFSGCCDRSLYQSNLYFAHLFKKHKHFYMTSILPYTVSLPSLPMYNTTIAMYPDSVLASSFWFFIPLLGTVACLVHASTHRWSWLWSWCSLNPMANLSQMGPSPRLGPLTDWAYCLIGLDWNHTLPLSTTLNPL